MGSAGDALNGNYWVGSCRSLKSEVITKSGKATAHLQLIEKEITSTRTILSKVAYTVLNKIIIRKRLVKKHFQPIGCR